MVLSKYSMAMVPSALLMPILRQNSRSAPAGMPLA